MLQRKNRCLKIEKLRIEKRINDSNNGVVHVIMSCLIEYYRHIGGK